MRELPRILLALEGLAMDGGVSSVSRGFARALDEEVRRGRIERVDRLLLHDAPGAVPPPARGHQVCLGGSKARFVFELHRAGLRWRHDWVLFDHIGVARAGVWPLPGAPARHAVMVHGCELEAVTPGSSFERSLLRAARVLTNSHFTAAQVEARLPALKGRIRPLRLCIEPDKVAAWEASGQTDAPADDRDPAALIVGRMWSVERGKGHDELLRAWPEVRRKVPDAELWIAGGGDDQPRLERLARDLGVAEAVRFLGRISDEELSARYRRARLYAMPSRQEGFGLVYVEAMWHGLACLGSTCDAATEVIEDGKTGVLVPYGDVDAVARAVVSILADPERAVRLGEAGRRRVREHYAWPKLRDDFLEALGLA